MVRYRTFQLRQYVVLRDDDEREVTVSAEDILGAPPRPASLLIPVRERGGETGGLTTASRQRRAAAGVFGAGDTGVLARTEDVDTQRLQALRVRVKFEN